MQRRVLVVLLMSAASAEAQSVRDSAGVRIVSYDARSVAPQRWSVEARPVLEIGGADGNGPAEFTDIVGVVLLAYGAIVVGNMKTNELRYFDRAGKFLHSSGRNGQGPGEFMQLWRVAARHDTVVAFDFRYGPRFFAPNGPLIRSLPHVSLEGGPPAQPIGPFADGRFLVAVSMNTDDPSGYDGSTAMRRVLRVAGMAATQPQWVVSQCTRHGVTLRSRADVPLRSVRCCTSRYSRTGSALPTHARTSCNAIHLTAT